MRTRNIGTPKSVSAKKTLAARKSATNAATNSTATANESVTPKTAGIKRGSAAGAKKRSPAVTIGSESKPEQSPVEVKPSADAATMTADSEVEPGTKVGAKRRPGRPKGKAGPKRTPKSAEAVKQKAEEYPKNLQVDHAKDLESEKQEETDAGDDERDPEEEEPMMEGEEILVRNGFEAAKEEILIDKEIVSNDDGECRLEEKIVMENDVTVDENVRSSVEQEEPFVTEVAKSSENETKCSEKGSQELKGGCKEQMEIDGEKNHQIEHAIVEENVKYEFQREEETEEDPYGGIDEGLGEYDDRLDFGEHEDEDLPDDDMEDPGEETEALAEECRQLTAIAKERRMKKECEIFIGGLDRDAVEEDVRRVFKKIGEVVEVRLLRNPVTNKNKGYAFVKFATKEQAMRALSEIKNPVICGKRCGTAPSEDNDTLFLGNICNTWTKEAIKQKLKDYGIEGLENITLVPDVQHEGLSRGFAFLEFSCHVDAMLAYKRLQRPDVIFGHPERTAKVAFAEPLREADPEIMAKVKTVFLDSLPPQWDEDHVREQLKGYGEIVHIVLARNMSTAKRKDFGFVDFSTHEAAIACINGVNNAELGDCNSKTKVRARLSNPLPKTQAIKGGMSGGFRIGHGGSRAFLRFGKSFGRGGRRFNWSHFQRGRGFYHHEQGRPSRIHPNNYDFDSRYAEFHGRHVVGEGGRWGHFRGGYHASKGVASTGSSRQSFDRSWHDAPDTYWEEHMPFRRPPFSPEAYFDRPYHRRHYDDRCSYDETLHGTKRPFYLTDHQPDYGEPSRVRPRLDYAYPEVPFHDTHFHDTYGAGPVGSGPYSHDYHVSDYGTYPPHFGANRSYRGGYY
ncbi:hypothetical protein SLA2020_184830 [Shorea laevis]